MNSYQIERTHSGTTLTPLETTCFDKGILFVDGSITEETATNFIQNGIVLASKEIPLTVIINSNGGDLQAGLNIYDFITSLKDVTTVAVKAYSMGAVLFAAGTKRIITPHGQVMIHEPLLSSGVSGSCSSVEAMSDVLKAKKVQIAQLLSKHTGKSIKELNKAMSKDTYFSAEEALKFGLCDSIQSWNKILAKEVMYD